MRFCLARLSWCRGVGFVGARSNNEQRNIANGGRTIVPSQLKPTPLISLPDFSPPASRLCAPSNDALYALPSLALLFHIASSSSAVHHGFQTRPRETHQLPQNPLPPHTQRAAPLFDNCVMHHVLFHGRTGPRPLQLAMDIHIGMRAIAASDLSLLTRCNYSS
jgi:hypothetical protein